MIKHNYLLIFLMVFVLCVPCLKAQTTADSMAIQRTALNYIEGWYQRDGERMKRALHPELAKRIVFTNDEGESELNHQGAMTLVLNTGEGEGMRIAPQKQQKEVIILDIYENAASVKIVANEWIDYLHMAKWNGEWKIINVLFELKPTYND